jgi:lysozyme
MTPQLPELAAIHGAPVDTLRRLLTLHEGERLRPYDDTVGKLTISIGRNLADRPLTHEETLELLRRDGISLEFSRWLFLRDLAATVTELTERLPWIATVDPVRQAAVIDMAYNLGLPRLQGFAHALEAMRTGLYGRAAAEMLESTWARQVGARSVRLAAMMRSGTWPADLPVKG